MKFFLVAVMLIFGLGRILIARETITPFRNLDVTALSEEVLDDYDHSLVAYGFRLAPSDWLVKRGFDPNGYLISVITSRTNINDNRGGRWN